MATTTDGRPAVTPLPGDEGMSATDTAVAARAAQAADRPRTPAVVPRGAGPNFNHFVLSQVPLTLAVALTFGIITFAAIRFMPTDEAGNGTSTPAAGAIGPASGAGSAPITAFSSEPAAQRVQVAADPTGAPRWDRSTYEARAGDVTFVVTNVSPSPHNFAIEGGNVKAQSPNFGGNTTNSYTIKGLAPGEYLIVCNFPGHREAGMVARLIVR